MDLPYKVWKKEPMYKKFLMSLPEGAFILSAYVCKEVVDGKERYTPHIAEQVPSRRKDREDLWRRIKEKKCNRGPFLVFRDTSDYEEFMKPEHEREYAKDYEYDEMTCAACGASFTMDQMHFNFMIYHEILEGDQLAPIGYGFLKWFHLECCDEKLIIEKALKDYTCNDCGREIQDGESLWEISALKDQQVYHIMEGEWDAPLRVFCEDCAANKDLHIPALEAIKEVVKPEFRDRITPVEGTYVPSQVKTCHGCGSRIEEDI